MTNILIIDRDKENYLNIASEFKSIDFINEVYSCSRGDHAIDIIAQNKIDFIVMDIFIYGKDGFDVLKYIYDNNLSKSIGILVASSLHDDKSISKALMLGADYYIIKPVSAKIVIEKSIELIQSRKKKAQTYNLHKEYSVNDIIYFYIGKFLSNLGVPTNLCGYRYLKTLVYLAIKDESLLTSYTKKLYPKGAEFYSTTPERVERSIRHAIKKAWSSNPSLMKENLGKFGIKAKPTASMIISLMAEQYNLQNEL